MLADRNVAGVVHIAFSASTETTVKIVQNPAFQSCHPNATRSLAISPGSRLGQIYLNLWQHVYRSRVGISGCGCLAAVAIVSTAILALVGVWDTQVVSAARRGGHQA